MTTGLTTMLGSRWLRSLLAFLFIAGFGGWYYVNDQAIRKEAWKGVVTEKWEDKPMLRGVGLDAQSKQKRRTKYYWRVTKEDGQAVEVKVPFNLYVSGNPGTQVEKIYSERYPRIK